ncbi:uncharacterized protein [Apostichopus japonicus]|uniref:uncharacterized protein n=1 Tax=Stichopus japonicus TaxID=307972 RepID=UPI003AB4947E
MWDHTRMAWAIYWIIIGSFVQAQEFSTTVVKEGEDATIECGLQTKVAEGYLKWETMTNGSSVDLAYDLRGGHTDCDDRIINCTLHANGSIQLESVSKEDGARYYRCLRGDENGYNYYSDHRLLVLSKESPSISQSPTSAIAFNVGRKGIVHSYGEQVCEDDVDGNLPLVCYPPSDIIVDRKYETIQCNCTDSDGLVDSVTFSVTKKTSSPPLFETPRRESVSSYNMGKKGVLHCYNAPVCEDDVDGNIPVDCYPPSGVIVDREYETIQCNCTDSDGLMNSVTFPVTRQMSSPPSIKTHHRESVNSYNMGKKGVLHGYNAPVCEDDVDGKLPVVCYPPSGIIVDREYETIQCNCTDSDELMDSVTIPVTSVTDWLQPCWRKAAIILSVISLLIILVLVLICCCLYKNHKKLKAYRAVNNSKIELTDRAEELIPLTEQLEQKEKQETEMKNKLEKQNEKTAKPEEMTSIQSSTKDQQISDLEDKIATPDATCSKRSTQNESQESLLKPLQEMLEMQEMLKKKMKNELEEQLENFSKTSTQNESPELLVKQLQKMLEMREMLGKKMKNELEEQHENFSKTSTQNESQESLLKQLQELLEMQEMLKKKMKNELEEQHENCSKTSTQNESPELLVKQLQKMLEMREMLEKKMKNELEEQHENFSKTSTQNESQESLLKQLQELLEMREMLKKKMKNELEEQHENCKIL